MSGGTEAFPDLGRHCQHSECNQLDFLPFKCDGCCKVFCLEHRSYKSHACPKSDSKSRKVVVCEICSMSIDTTGRDEEDEKMILEKHEKSGNCDPKRKKKPTCAVRRCKEVLTFSNTCVCKSCKLKVCLKHRFPGDHDCKKGSSARGAVIVANVSNNKTYMAGPLTSRNGKDCAKNGRGSTPATPSSPSVRVH